MNIEYLVSRCVLVIFCFVAFIAGHVCMGDQYMNMNSMEITSLLQSKDYEALGKYVDSLNTNWSAKPDMGYFDALLTLCNEVTGFGESSEESERFLLTVVENALAKNSPQGIQSFELLDKQADFLNVLMNTNAFGGTLSFRENRCQLLVTFFAQINRIRDPAYVPVEEIATIPPIVVDGIKPGEIPLGAGMNPDAIKNEALRREYEKRIRENKERSERNQAIMISNRIYSRFESKLRMFFIGLYKDSGDEGRNTLMHWLRAGGFSKAFKDNVLAEVP